MIPPSRVMGFVIVKISPLNRNYVEDFNSIAFEYTDSKRRFLPNNSDFKQSTKVFDMTILEGLT